MSFTDIPGTPAALTSIFGFAANDIWAVAQGPMHVYHFDGTAFTQVTDPDTGFIGSSLGNIWGPSPGSIYCVVEVTGIGPFPPGRLKFSNNNGLTWSNVNLPNNMDHVHYVFGFGMTDLYIVVNGAAGNASSDIWHSSDSGASWTKIMDGAVDPPGIFYMLSDGQPPLAGTGPNDLWAMADGMLGHYDGVSWTFYNQPVDNHPWFNIISVAPGELYVGSFDGNIMHITGNGASRVLETPQPYAGAFCVFGTNAGVYAIESYDPANFKVQKRVNATTWNYVSTQPGTNATVGYSPDGVAAVVLGDIAQQQTAGPRWTDVLWPPLQFPQPTNPNKNGGAAAPAGNWLQAVEVHTTVSKQLSAPVPPPPLPAPASIVAQNTTATEIRDYFRIINGTTDPALQTK